MLSGATSENVISGTSSEALSLVIKLDKLSLVQSPVDGPQQAVVSEFPEVGKTTGTLPGTYRIKLVEVSRSSSLSSQTTCSIEGEDS